MTKLTIDGSLPPNVRSVLKEIEDALNAAPRAKLVADATALPEPRMELLNVIYRLADTKVLVVCDGAAWVDATGTPI